MTSGTITGFHIAITSSECDAVIDGTSGSAHNGKVDITDTNSTHRLKILGPGDNLHLWDVKGACKSAVHNGDAGTITSSYAISPAQAITGSCPSGSALLMQ